MCKSLLLQRSERPPLKNEIYLVDLKNRKQSAKRGKKALVLQNRRTIACRSRPNLSQILFSGLRATGYTRATKANNAAADNQWTACAPPCQSESSPTRPKMIVNVSPKRRSEGPFTASSRSKSSCNELFALLIKPPTSVRMSAPQRHPTAVRHHFR